MALACHGSNLFNAIFRAKLCFSEVLKGPDRDRRRDRISGPAGFLYLPDVAEQPASGAGEVAGSGPAHQNSHLAQPEPLAGPFIGTRCE